jgi:niacin transporter
MTAAALLTAVGIAIPLMSPVKIIIEPASFTLASHVAIFIAMMMGPATAAVVVTGTFLGFFLSAPLPIAVRAASHIVFAMLGAFYLRRNPSTLNSAAKTHAFSFVIGLIHGGCEVLAVCALYFNGLWTANYQLGIVWGVGILVGVGSVIHSMVDFEISYAVYKALSRQRGLAALLGAKPRVTE